MAPSLSKEYRDGIWNSIEKLRRRDRTKLLEGILSKREEIKSFKDIKPGDHLVRKGSSLRGRIKYEHHFLCIGIDSEGPVIVHYYNTPSAAGKEISSTGSYSSGTAIEKLAKIQIVTLPNKDFIADENALKEQGVKRVVWPEELRRYSVEEIIERAKGRNGETYYNLIKNNCESFVMWCLCGLNITLQATLLRRGLYETVYGIFRSIWNGVQQIPKFVAELLDHYAVAVSSKIVRICLGAGIIVIVEAIMAAYQIRQAYKKWKDGGAVIKTREKFIQEVIDIVLPALLRSGISIIGMSFGGFPGAAAGLAGVFGGHLVGKGILEGISKCSGKLARLIDSMID